MRKYKYKNLSKKAKERAILEYRAGYHGYIEADEVHTILLVDLDGYRYSIDGALITIDGEKVEDIITVNCRYVCHDCGSDNEVYNVNRGGSQLDLCRRCLS